MKLNKIYNAITIVLIAIVIAGCDKVPVNGDLDGLWQLMEIKQGEQTIDKKADRLYCSFQLSLFMLGRDGGKSRLYFGRFERDGGTLHFYDFTFRAAYTEESTLDRLMTDEDIPTIAPWGFYAIDCPFEIVTLNSQALVIKHGDTVITYRKM